MTGPDMKALRTKHSTVSDPATLRGESIICFAGEDWWYQNPQSSQHLMRAFARNGNRVLFVNSTGIRVPCFRSDPYAWKRIRGKLGSFARLIRRAEPRLFVFTPLAFPATRTWRTAVMWLNRLLLPLQLRALCMLLGFGRPILWVSNPALKDIAIDLRRRWAKCLVYYCVDNIAHLEGADPAFVGGMDSAMQASADIALFAGRRLFDERKSGHAHSYLLPHGVDFDHFAADEERPGGAPAPVPPEGLRDVPLPIAGYMGAIRSLDFALIRSVAVASPQVSFVLIGDSYARISEFADLRNVHFLGRKPYADLPHYLQSFQCCCVFYQTGDKFNDYRSPKKLLEYLATGRPVVSVPLRELEDFDDCVYVARTREQFPELLKAALSEDDPERRLRRIRRARARDWSVVAREASLYIREAMDREERAIAALRQGPMSSE